MKDTVVILSATRSPIGSFCGVFSSVKAHELGAQVVKAAISQAQIEASDVTDVVLGHILTAGQGQNTARQAAMGAGIPHTVPAYCVNMLCGSGLKAVSLAYLSILDEPSAIVVAGGQECMSQAPHLQLLRTPTKMGNIALLDSLLCDGLNDAFHNIHMGNTAENIAAQKEIGRFEQDAYALESQRRTEVAVKEGMFSKEITPITLTVKGKPVTVESDEYPRPGTSLDTLARLKPVFVKEGTVTAGNASGVNDGAAALVLTSASNAAAKQLKPRARIIGFAKAGVDPLVMGLGPIPAIQKLLKKINWNKDDVDLFELNEAFAVQALACTRELDLNPEKVNVNGGAIALGHPIGASGARILVTLIHTLEHRKLKKGVAALCIGGGMGIAMAIEIC